MTIRDHTQLKIVLIISILITAPKVYANCEEMAEVPGASEIVSQLKLVSEKVSHLSGSLGCLHDPQSSASHELDVKLLYQGTLSHLKVETSELNRVRLLSSAVRTLANYPSSKSDEYLKCLIEKFPSDINDFISLNAQGPIINTGGLCTLVDRHQNRASAEKTHQIIPVENIFDENNNILEQLKESSKDLSVTLIIKTDFDNPKGLHRTPVLISKKDGVAKIVISDSTGGEDYSPGYSIGTIELLRDAFPSAEITWSKMRRQRDATNCPVFSFHDALYFSRDPEGVLKKIESLRKVPPPRNSRKLGLVPPPAKTYTLDDLPVEMMLGAQSLSQLAAYEKTSLSTPLRAQDKILLGSTLAQHTQKNGDGKFQNRFIQNTFNQYASEILDKYVSLYETGKTKEYLQSCHNRRFQ